MKMIKKKEMKTGKRERGKALAFLFAALFAVSPAKAGTALLRVNAEGADYAVANPNVVYNYHDTVTFGSYWQEDTDGDGSFGEDEKQPITWQILQKYTDGTALVVSDKILSFAPYNNEKNAVSWEDSQIRSWLNKDFYDDAFSANDKTAIIETDVVNDDNTAYETDGGNNTKDKVFLLSLDEVKNSSYGFNENLQTDDQGRTARPTTFVKSALSIPHADETISWWLRSPGSSKSSASCVVSSGFVTYFDVDRMENGIRPALRVNLSSPYVKTGEKVKISVKGCEWDTVTFGRYNGKDISWRVLDVSGDNAFLVSDMILDKKAYNDKYTEVTWKDSTIRKWLNEDFLRGSFNDAEKEMIMTSTVTNSGNGYYGTEGGEDTADKIFLLSLEDIKQPRYGFPDLYWVKAETREAKDSADGVANWWLRTPGYDSLVAAYVSRSGYVYDEGYNVDSVDGIRPALRINLKSSAWKKGEKVSAGNPVEGGEEPAPVSPPTIAPTPSPTPTATPTPIAEPSKDMKATPSPKEASAKDNVTSFKIGKTVLKNKKTIKKTAKIKISDKDKIKKITLNGKTIKIKKNKTSFTLKLKSYKKKLKKKGKWNKLVVTDVKGNKKTIKFKTK